MKNWFPWGTRPNPENGAFRTAEWRNWERSELGLENASSEILFWDAVFCHFMYGTEYNYPW